MADDLKLLVPWSFWHIPLKDLTSFQKISYQWVQWVQWAQWVSAKLDLGSQAEIMRLWQPGHSQTQMGSENVHGTLIIGHLGELAVLGIGHWALGNSDLGFEKWPICVFKVVKLIYLK